MKQTLQANRTHITLLGKCNSGKSSLLNAMTSQELAIVSEIPGTTTDPVSKTMEIPGIGPCVLIDTAGFDDTSTLGKARLEKTRQMLRKTDIVIMVYRTHHLTEELAWAKHLTKQHIPVIHVINEEEPPTAQIAERIRQSTGDQPLIVNAKTGKHIDRLLNKIAGLKDRSLPHTLTGDLVKAGDIVLLVMPQDPQAPKERLILPQAQTLRELLDKQCVPVACTPQQLETAMAALTAPPSLIITDSQVYREVKERVPPTCKVTTFSILFAAYKGDIEAFIEGAKAIGQLTPQSRVLIAEACTHAPISEDIGREKLPRMLRQQVGEALQVDVVSGADFPADLSAYALVIHCGACMFNRRHMLSRIEQARAQGVPISNYGVAIAYLSSAGQPGWEPPVHPSARPSRHTLAT